MPGSTDFPDQHRPHPQPPAVVDTAKPRTVIVLLNWNGAPDTIECIQSLLRMEDQNFLLVVCDNDSADGSFERLCSWGASALPAQFAAWNCALPPKPGAKLILIQTGANLGFAGGCNVGLRYALLHTEAEFVWLLNNDTVVDTSALTHQIDAMRQQPEVGMLGSTLISFHNPTEVQAPGGYDFNFWTARVLKIANAISVANLPDESEVEARLKFISGASMLIRRSFLEKVGLLNEQYFLYFEEVDWAWRGRDNFRLGYCSSSRIWHKEGNSIGSHRLLAQRSAFSEGYLARNRVLFLKTYFPWQLPVALGYILGVGSIRMIQGQRKLAWTLWTGAIRGLFAPVRALPAVDEWPESMRRGPDGSEDRASPHRP